MNKNHNKQNVKVLMSFSYYTSPDHYYNNNLSEEKKERCGSPPSWTCPPSVIEGGKLDLQEFIVDTCLKTPFSKLVLGHLPELTSLMLEGSNLGCLDISECFNLINMNFCENKSAALQIKINNFVPIKKLNLNLSCLREFVNLEVLYLYKYTFYSSLEPLNNIDKLKLLSISFTDISSGLEYLANNID
ncbi:42795_t:CDS:2 [Gigaspora margarita]|uniref:42795_t:CDS:1 n=1 Tax=Gigaspora margarita TaxID=4874 RepID=A0ABN7XB38_GIGMA|nr:42795_t:CDS:2 [Gigaspora margarita]